MSLTPQQWSAVLAEALKVLDQMLLPAKLAQTQGNRFRLGEYFQKAFEQIEDQRPTDPKVIANLFYGFIVNDVNKVVNQPGYESQLFWEVKPKKLIGHEQNIRREVVHPNPNRERVDIADAPGGKWDDN